jgi:hypothetical protein
LRTAVQYDGAIEVAFEARTNGKLIQLLAHGQHAVTWSFGATARSLFVTRPDRTTQIAKVASLEPNRWYSFRYAITPQGIAITVDGESVFTENGAYGAFSSSPVGIENGPDSAVDIRGFVVKQL